MSEEIESIQFFLVRHGEAVSEHEDPDRPLTDKGLEEVTAVGRTLYQRRVEVGNIYHSHKLRAKQTAEAIAEEIESEEGIEEVDGLQPLDDVSQWRDKIDGRDSPCMLVGHLPYMSRILSDLLDKKETSVPVFLPGTCLCVGRVEGKYEVEWVLYPREALEEVE